MSAESDIEAALMGRVRDMVLSPTREIAWPNRPFTPPSGGYYIAVDMLRNQNDRLFLKGSDPHRHQGILQLTVVSPQGVGYGPATVIAGDIAAHFPCDLALYNGSVKVKVTKTPDIAQAVLGDVSWSVPVSVYYEAFV